MQVYLWISTDANYFMLSLVSLIKCPEGRQLIARGEAPGSEGNIESTPKGWKKKEFALIKFESLFSALNKAKVRYLVVGGIAVNLYGIERATADIDLFVEMPFNFDIVYEAREEIHAEKTIIPVVPIKYLIEMKEKVGRPQDIADVFYLKKIEKEWRDE